MKKQLKKTAVVTLLALGASLAGSVMAFAEQPKAAEYRNIINSGTYYIVYNMDGAVSNGLAVSGDQRMYYCERKSSNGGLALLGFIPGIGWAAAAAAMIDTSHMEPEVFFDGTKYYQRDMKDRVWRAATDAQISDLHINPEQYWPNAKMKLSVPDIFRVFASDAYSNQFQDGDIPTFVESGVENNKKGEKKYDFDKYTAVYKDQNGKSIYEHDVYYYYNKDGELEKILAYNKGVENDGKGYLESTIKVGKITSELPKNAFRLKNGTKVYAPGMGDMADLLDQKILTEEIKNPDELKENAASEAKEENE